MRLYRFYGLQNELSVMGQTVTFDHAGSGWSTDSKSNRTIENLVNELSILVDTVCPDKPVVLICHSLGSLEAIAYTQLHAQKVKGIIFLDAGSPEFYSTDSEVLAGIINRGIAFARTIGLNRLLGELGFLLPLYGESIRNSRLPENVGSLDKAMYYRFAEIQLHWVPLDASMKMQQRSSLGIHCVKYLHLFFPLITVTNGIVCSFSLPHGLNAANK
ncbi:alpha/beta fold hydrolase [Anoxybacterium hadale]|uniref:Alpha/beta fold hydrolase n=1 Tax=Anoxybacterium hadale TaxID=3408580 RepID=A0ACD1ABL8_9FIRM|nr:alpha/beta fold hydrolase [Clostridiales bacterium]